MERSGLVEMVFQQDLKAHAEHLGLSSLLSGTYAAPDQVVRNSAAASTHLFALNDEEGACAAFMFARCHAVRDWNAVYLGPAGARSTHRGRGLQRRLFSLFDKALPAVQFPLAWGITASPIMLRAWSSFFGASWPTGNVALPFHDTKLADELWTELGARAASDAPMIARGQFHRYTAAELDRLRSARPTSASPLDGIDASLGDRLLLLAHRLASGQQRSSRSSG